MLDEMEIRKKLIDFEARFGRSGKIDVYYAPGRVNLIGEHTDYNGGLVLPFAIQQGTYLLIRPSDLPPARLYSDELGLEARVMTPDITKKNDWADYVRGVYMYASEVVCGEIPPFDAMYFGDLPLDSGLSSSASLEMATALGLGSLDCRLSKEDAVKVCRRAENDFVGVACGVMDQFTVAFAKERHAILLDCDTLDYRQVPYNLKDTVLVVGHTGVRRSLTDSDYNKRRRECAEALSLLSAKIEAKRNLSQFTINEFEGARWSIPDTLALRAEHVIYENVRVEEAARCLETGDPETLGYLLNRSHESLRDLFEVSSFELDTLQEISASQPGVWGCRMTGAGFGGCVIALVKEDALERYLGRVPGLYWKSTHCDAGFVVTTPGEGASMLEIL
ncbi:MAG: galactokinase [Actinobacteria bacterium]|nr:galactokinase [Actinomycetota bacterium]